MGRIPAERTTIYAIRRAFPDPADDPFEPLDEAAEHQERFGSYFELIQMDKFRFREPTVHNSPLLTCQVELGGHGRY